MEQTCCAGVKIWELSAQGAFPWLRKVQTVRLLEPGSHKGNLQVSRTELLLTV